METNINREFVSLVPGPCEIDDRVRAALSRQVHSHLHPDWNDCYLSTVHKLRRLLGTSGDAYLMLASATSVMESVIMAVCGVGERLLVLKNGYFGLAMANVATYNGRLVDYLEFPEDQGVDAEALGQHLATAGGRYRAVGVVHSESSTGTLNDIRAVAEVARSAGLPLIVDAVSSLGGAELAMDDWGLDFVVSGGQKALGSITGAGILGVASDAWRFVREDADDLGHYSNLRIWREAQQSNPIHPYPWSMSESVVWATEAALDAIEEEGLEARIARHRGIASFYRSELAKLGFEPFIAEHLATPTVVSIKAQESLPVDDLAAALRENHGILIGKGIYSQRGKIWRIGNMGVQSSMERAEQLIAALKAEMS